MRYDFPKLRYYWVSGNPLRYIPETNIKYQIGEGIDYSFLILEIRFFPKIGFLEPHFQKLFAGNIVKVWKRK